MMGSIKRMINLNKKRQRRYHWVVLLFLLGMVAFPIIKGVYTFIHDGRDFDRHQEAEEKVANKYLDVCDNSSYQLDDEDKALMNKCEKLKAEYEKAATKFDKYCGYSDKEIKADIAEFEKSLKPDDSVYNDDRTPEQACLDANTPHNHDRSHGSFTTCDEDGNATYHEVIDGKEVNSFPTN